MPGIEAFDKKKTEREAPKPVEPAWTKLIDKMVFERLGGKPEGYTRHTVKRLWDSTFRMNVWARTETAKKETKDRILSWFLVFTPGGELIRSDPELPAFKK